LAIPLVPDDPDVPEEPLTPELDTFVFVLCPVSL